MNQILKYASLQFFPCIALFGQAQVQSDSAFLLRPDSLTFVQIQKLDSIKTTTEADYNTFKNSYDSIAGIASATEQKLQHEIDSLTQWNIPTLPLKHKLDSVSAANTAALGKMRKRWDEQKTRHANGIRDLNLPPPWDQPQQELLSATDKLDLTLPKSEFSLPSISSSNPIGIDLPSIDSPFGELNLDEPEIPGIPDELGEVKQYTDQVKEINDGNVDKAIDQQLAKVDDLNTFQEQQTQFQMPETNANKAKQQYLSLAKESAKAHFSQKFEQVDQAMGKISKLKTKYANVQSMKDLPKRRPNEMKEKSLVGRLVPAVGLQLMQRNSWTLDANPSIGYRFNQYLSSGIGWNQRWAYDFDANKYVHPERLYGPRVYTEYKLKRGIALRAESDYVNALIRTRFGEPLGRDWVWNVLAGIRKDYKINKRINGHLQLVYNLIDQNDQSPYPRFNLRIGFEWNWKKPRLQKNIPSTSEQ